MPFPWQPGMKITDSRLNEHLPVSVSKSATESRSSTVVTADAELALALSPGRWSVSVHVSYAGTATANSGIVAQWSLPAGMTLVGFRLVNGPAAGSSGSASVSMRASVNSATTSLEYGAGAGFAALEESGIIDVSAAGTFAFAWAKAAAGASAQVGIGSFLEARRIA